MNKDKSTKQFSVWLEIFVIGVPCGKEGGCIGNSSFICSRISRITELIFLIFQQLNSLFIGIGDSVFIASCLKQNENCIHCYPCHLRTFIVILSSCSFWSEISAFISTAIFLKFYFSKTLCKNVCGIVTLDLKPYSL